MSYWRQRAREVILPYLKSHPECTTPETMKAGLREVYPFGQRQYYPYRVWLDEVNKLVALHFGQTLKTKRPGTGVDSHQIPLLGDDT